MSPVIFLLFLFFLCEVIDFLVKSWREGHGVIVRVKTMFVWFFWFHLILVDEMLVHISKIFSITIFNHFIKLFSRIISYLKVIKLKTFIHLSIWDLIDVLFVTIGVEIRILVLIHFIHFIHVIKEWMRHTLLSWVAKIRIWHKHFIEKIDDLIGRKIVFFMECIFETAFSQFWEFEFDLISKIPSSRPCVLSRWS